MITQRLDWAKRVRQGHTPKYRAYEAYKEHRLDGSFRLSASSEEFFEYVIWLEYLAWFNEEYAKAKSSR